MKEDEGDPVKIRRSFSFFLAQSSSRYSYQNAQGFRKRSRIH